MIAAELREALEREILWKRTDVIKTAARLWLRILEGDEQLVEKAAAEISDGRWANDSSPAIARAVLAAITEEEQK